MKLFYALDEEYVISFSTFLIYIKDEEKYEIENEYASNNWKINGVDQPARKLKKSGNSEVYAYRFDWDEEPKYLWMDFSKIFGAAHGFEIPFVTGNFDYFGFEKYIMNDKNRPAAIELSNSMMSYWAEFAYKGNPGKGRQKNLINWLPWQNGPERAKFIVLDSSNDKGIFMSKSELFYNDELQRLAEDNRIKDLQTRCKYIENLKESGNQSNFSLKECKKL
jgi:para-nitrobenzyl esterase